VERADLKREVRVVYQNVDGTKLVPGSFGHPIDFIFFRDVGLEDEAANTVILDFGEDGEGGFFVAVIIDDDFCARLRQAFCGRGTDSSTRAGNKRDLPFEGANLSCHDLIAKGIQIATASSDAPFSYFAAFPLKDRNFIFT